MEFWVGNIGSHDIFCQKGKPLDVGNIRGALEIISYKSAVIFCDRRLNHHLIPSKKELYLKFIYASPVLLGKRGRKLDLNTLQEQIYHSIHEICMKPYVDSYKILNVDNNFQCLKKITLNKDACTNYEDNMQMSITYVKDFLSP